MIKKFLAILILTASMVLLPSAANAVTDNGSCSYDNPNPNYVNTSLTVTREGANFYVVGKLYNDGQARTWDWDMFHNGSQSASGTKVGGFTVDRYMVDFNGSDTIEFRVRNDARTITCWAKVIMS